MAYNFWYKYCKTRNGKCVGANAKRKACVERENFMKSIFKRIFQSTFFLVRAGSAGTAGSRQKVLREALTSCLTRHPTPPPHPFPLPTAEHMARENIIMDSDAVLMRQMATMTKETDTSTRRRRGG